MSMRVALDTNVVISALAFPGSVSDKAMTRMILSDCQILLCNQVLTELRMVVRRKFPEKTESIERFLRDFSYLEISESSSVNLSSEQIPDVRDPSDLPILLSAITAKAEDPELSTISRAQLRFRASMTYDFTSVRGTVGFHPKGTTNLAQFAREASAQKRGRSEA